MSLVRIDQFFSVLDTLNSKNCWALDTETTGIYPYRGDRLFSIIIGDDRQQFYFNFQPYEGLDSRYVLPRDWIKTLSGTVLSNDRRYWYMHNARFDLHMLAQEGASVSGTVHCTQAIARVLRNDLLSYSLEDCAERIGRRKDDRVKNYVLEKGLWSWEENPFRKVRQKRFYYHQVPIDLIVPYACQDVAITYALGEYQRQEIQKIDATCPEKLSLKRIVALEQEMTKICFEMERVGVKIDREYCERALRHEKTNEAQAQAEFKELTGLEFKDSSKLFTQVFSGEDFVLTEKGNPSFESGVLETFKSPVAQVVLKYRDAKSRSNFYSGFLYHADSQDTVRPWLHPDGTVTGRFSSSNPNFQNLTKEEDVTKEFLIRRAIVPRPGFILAMFDWDQMEFRLMLDYAGETGLINKILKEGLDVHEVTAQLAGVSRSQAKMTNFAVLYGSGIARLAQSLKTTLEEANRIRNAILDAAPRVKELISQVKRTARTRGYIFNWKGRRYYFSDPNLTYKAVNYLIQGGCADVVKTAMVDISRLLRGRKSRMLLQVHDELVMEIHKSERDLIPTIKSTMERAYPYRYLPLTVSVEVSSLSWADKEAYEETGNSVQGSGSSAVEPASLYGCA